QRSLRSFPTRRSSDLAGESSERESAGSKARFTPPPVRRDPRTRADPGASARGKRLPRAPRLGRRCEHGAATRAPALDSAALRLRSEEHTSELQSRENL